MKINFNEMNNDVRSLYEAMWTDSNRIPGNICRTYNKHYKVESKNSYSFEITGIQNKDLDKNHITKISNELIKIFGIKNAEVFKEKLYEACNGSGDEALKITTLHSSSLCALLFFYNVKEHPVTLKLNGKEILFNDVMFEYKTRVTQKGGPSNMDIVLISDRDKSVLFLESKFSEYLTTVSSKDISYTYKKEFGNEIYNEDFLSRIGFKFVKKENSDNDYRWIKINKEGKKEEYFTIKPAETKTKIFIEGIKQMISHFIGVRNFTQNCPADSEKRYINNSYSVYLGEILFDKLNFQKADELMENYSKYYNSLIKELNKLEHSFTLVESPLVYSDLKDYISEQGVIKKFYFGG